MIFGWLSHKNKQKINTASGDLNARGTETVLRDMQAILSIRRLWRSFHGGSAVCVPPPTFKHHVGEHKNEKTVGELVGLV